MIGFGVFAVLAGLCVVLWLVLSAGRVRNPIWYLLVALVLLAVHAAYQDYLSDDAFISMRYARNLADGKGLVFNEGERVEGYTNPLWVLILAGVRAAGFDMVAAARFLGLLFAGMILVVAFRLSQCLEPNAPPGSRISALLLASSAPLAVWALSGLETAFFTFLVLGGLNELLRGRLMRAGLWLAVSALARPEGVLFLALAAGKEALEKGDGAGRAGRVLRLIAPAVVILVPFELWRISYYGELLPNTFYAKTGGGLTQAIRGAKYLFKFFWAYGGFFLFIGIGLFGLLRGSRSTRWAAAIVAGYLLYVVGVGGDGLPGYRFVVPALPVLYILVEIGTRELYGMARSSVGMSWRSSALAAVVIAILAASGTVGYRERVVNRRISQDFILIGKWMRRNLDPDATIAVSAVGAIPFYSGLKTVDRLGLTDKHIARVGVAGMGSGPAGHEKHDSDYVLSRRPTVLTLDWNGLTAEPIEGKSPEEIERIVDLAFDGREIWRDPRFRSQYVAKSVQLRPGGWFNYFVLGPDPVGGLCEQDRAGEDRPLNDSAGISGAELFDAGLSPGGVR